MNEGIIYEAKKRYGTCKKYDMHIIPHKRINTLSTFSFTLVFIPISKSKSHQ